VILDGPEDHYGTCRRCRDAEADAIGAEGEYCEACVDARRDEIQRELDAVKAEIDVAYWAFTRQARGVPPCLARPDLYDRRRELTAELRALRGRRP